MAWPKKRKEKISLARRKRATLETQVLLWEWVRENSRDIELSTLVPGLSQTALGFRDGSILLGDYVTSFANRDALLEWLNKRCDSRQSSFEFDSNDRDTPESQERLSQSGE